MSTATIEIAIEAPISIPIETALERSPVECKTEVPSERTALERLIEKENYWRFLEGEDALAYLSLLSDPRYEQAPIETETIQSKLSSFLPTDPQLERRTRKLRWQISKGRQLTSEWDYVFYSELTTAEQKLSEADFLNLYPDHVEQPTNKGGRPRKYKTPSAERKGHAERQRRYRERKSSVVSDVTRTPLQITDNPGVADLKITS